MKLLIRLLMRKVGVNRVRILLRCHVRDVWLDGLEMMASVVGCVLVS